jgi:hypothetical protein
MAKVKCESAFTQLDKLNVRESRKLTINGQEVPVINPGYFTDCYTAMYSDSTTFAITGNVIDKFQIGRQVQLDSGHVNDLTPDDIYTVNKFDYSVITGVTWDGVLTRVTIADAILTSDLEEVCLSINFPAQTLLTTTELINSSEGYPLEAVIKTTGYTTAGDGGGAEWIQNGVYAQTASQAPKDLGSAILNDATGNQWSLVNLGDIDIAYLGATPLTDSNLIFNAALSSVIDGGTVSNNVINNAESSIISIPPNKPLTLDLGKIKLPDNADTKLVEGSNCDRVTVTGKFIDGNKANQTPPMVAGERYLISFITDNIGITVKDCYIKNSVDGTIQIDDTEEVIVTGNTIKNSFTHAIRAAGSAPGNEKTVIASNIIDGVEEGAGIIPMGSAKYTSVMNNSISDINGTSGDAITCYSDNNSFISITGNVIRNVSGHGIHTGGEYVSVVGNSIDTTTAAGVYISAQTIDSKNIAVSGNTINNAGTDVSTFARDGIFINGVENFSVVGNSVFDGQDNGIHLKNTVGGTVVGNSISTCVNTGIYSEINGIRNIISNNVIRSTGSSAMVFDDEDQTVINSNLIENWSNVDAAGYGIDITSGTLPDISGNYIRRGSGTVPGVGNSLNSGATDLRALNNHISTSGTIQTGSVASATTINIPDEYDFVVVSGTTQIDSISTNTWNGREIALRCNTAGLTIKDGVGNIILNGDFITSGSSSFIKLLYSGGSWFETSRSIN